MEKKKKRKKRRILGLTIGEFCASATVILSMIGFAVGAVHYLDGKFESIDRRFEAIDRRFERIEHRLDKIEIELRKTSDLLDMYLTWRFIYVNDPVRKNLIPVYDPRKRTLEFVEKERSGK